MITTSRAAIHGTESAPARYRHGLLVACLLLAGCGLGEVDGFAWLRPTDNFHAIAPGQAYRSAQLDGESFRLVFDLYGVRTVVNLRGQNEDKLWYQNEKAATAETGVTLVDIAMSAESLPSRENLLLLYDTFMTAEHPILIHCQSGANRTGAASAIWRMVVLGDSREAAMGELSFLYGISSLMLRRWITWCASSSPTGPGSRTATPPREHPAHPAARRDMFTPNPRI